MHFAFGSESFCIRYEHRLLDIEQSRGRIEENTILDFVSEAFNAMWLCPVSRMRVTLESKK